MDNNFFKIRININFKLMLFLIIGIAMFYGDVLSAQAKFEHEYRIKDTEIPTAAREFVADLNFNKKIKWYREEGLNTTSVEAKTKYQEQRYSIEFSEAGELEDVEIEIHWDAITTTAQREICNYLSSQHDRFRIKKIQQQYTGTATALLQTIRTPTAKEDVTLRYELVVETQDGDKFRLHEYLFADDGKQLKKAVILLKNSDHLEY